MTKQCLVIQLQTSGLNCYHLAYDILVGFHITLQESPSLIMLENKVKLQLRLTKVIELSSKYRFNVFRVICYALRLTLI